VLQIAVALTEDPHAHEDAQRCVQRSAVGNAVEVDRDLGVRRGRPHLRDQLVDEELGPAPGQRGDREAQEGVGPRGEGRAGSLLQGTGAVSAESGFEEAGGARLNDQPIAQTVGEQPHELALVSTNQPQLLGERAACRHQGMQQQRPGGLGAFCDRLMVDCGRRALDTGGGHLAPPAAERPLASTGSIANVRPTRDIRPAGLVITLS